MELELLKDWGDHKKGDKVFITDQSVINEGLKIGLFKSESETTEEVDSEKKITEEVDDKKKTTKK